MSIQNLDQLTNRIGVATDQLEVAVVAVRESAGVVEGGTGESAQSAREAAASAVTAQQAASQSNSHRESALLESTRASTYATQASNSAVSSAVSESNAQTAANNITSQVDVAGAKANQATAQATVATQRATEATTQASKATEQATIATTQAAAAKQSAIDAANIAPSTVGMVEEAPKTSQLYGRVDGGWGLIPTGGGSSGGGTGSVDSVNGVAPDAGGNVTIPIPSPVEQVRSDWNAVSGKGVILNKPALFDGTYSALTGKPTLFSGNYNDLTNKPNAVASFSGDYNDLTNRPEIPVVTPQVNPDWLATSGKGQILNKPVLFDGRYESLTGKPTIPTGGGGTSNITNNNQLTNGAGYITDSPNDNKWYARKGRVWTEVVAATAFSGDYRDLTNKPVLNTDGTIGSGGSGFNGDYNDLVNKPPLITSNTQIFNGAGYLKDAIADNKQYVRKNNKWEVFVSNAEKGHAVSVVGGRIYASHTRTEDPKRLFNFWSHPNPHIPYPLYHLGMLSPYLTWITDGAFITAEYFSYLPSGRYSFSQASFPSGHVLAMQTGYIEVVEVTTPQAIPTLENSGGFTKFSTLVAYVINNNNQIVSTYDFNTATGEMVLRASGGGNSGVTPFSGRYVDLAGKPTLFSGSYNDLANKPTLFSGDYNDLINTPPPSTGGGSSFSGNYNDLTNKPVLFGGTYAALTGKPTIPTKLSQLTEDISSTFVASKVKNKRTGTAFEEWIGTQAQYDAITPKDANTRYWITEV